MRKSAESARLQRLNVKPEFHSDHESFLDDPQDTFYCLLHLKGKKYKVFYGGRGGRKSWSIAEAIIRRMVTENLRVLCTREYQNTVKDSVHRLLCDTIDRLGMQEWFHTTDSTIRSRNGSEVIYKGLHANENEIKSTEGIDICWIEEGQSITKNSLKVIGPTIRKAGSEIWISFNTKEETDPVYARFVVKGDQEAHVVLVNFDSNPYFTEELEKERQTALRDIEIADNDEERKQAQCDYDWVWMGAPHKLSNEIIYAGKWVSTEFPDDLWKEAPRLLFGEDFGFSQDPAALVRMFILNDCLYITHEAGGIGLDFHGNMKEGKGELEQMHDQVPDTRSHWPIKCDSARPETISFLRGLGFAAKAAEKWPGSVEDGIAHIRGFRKIIVHPRCKNTIRELKLYKYKVDRLTGDILPIIVDKHNHYMDAIRYALDGYIQRRGDIGIWTRLGQGYKEAA